MANLGVIEETEPRSTLVPGRAEPTEPSYIGVTTAFDKTVFIGDAGGLQTLRLGGSALTSGYTWGRAGPGPREVARAILIDATGNEMLAERLCRPFTWEVVSKLPADEFCITRADVLAWIEDPRRSLFSESSSSRR